MGTTRRKILKQNKGKSLIGRITPNDRGKTNLKPDRKEGYTVVNGKLVSANDVGVLLRQATTKVETRKLAKLRNGNKFAKNDSKTNDHPQRGGSAKKAHQPKRINLKPRNHPVGKFENKLVISTENDVSNKVLLFQNLALGVNQESLKTVLQQLSDARIAKVRVKDLPSGSATANVWLSNPRTQELERVRRLFHGALVDGRTISVLTVAENSQKLSY